MVLLVVVEPLDLFSIGGISFPYYASQGGSTADLSLNASRGLITGTGGGYYLSLPARLDYPHDTETGVGSAIPSGTYRIGLPGRHTRLGPAAGVVPESTYPTGDKFLLYGREPDGRVGGIDIQRLLQLLAATGGGRLRVYR